MSVKQAAFFIGFSLFSSTFRMPNAGVSCGRARLPGGPARRVLRRRRDGSGRQLNAEL